MSQTCVMPHNAIGTFYFHEEKGRVLTFDTIHFFSKGGHLKSILLSCIAVLLIGCTSTRPPRLDRLPGEKTSPISPDEKWANLISTHRQVKDRFHYTSDMALYGSSDF